jgi:hypothetical protein
MHNLITPGTLVPLVLVLALVAAGCWVAWEALRSSTDPAASVSEPEQRPLGAPDHAIGEVDQPVLLPAGVA